MIGLLLSRGADGVPAPAPVEFGPGFVLPRSPNAHLLAPPGLDLPAHGRFGPWPVAPARVWEALLEAAAEQPRTYPLAAWPERLQAQWVARTRLMNFPDIVVGQVTEGPAGSGLVLYSRSLLGWSDLGANAARLAAWRRAVEGRLVP
ncbi:MAG: DUF1499 domain-containing protein [Acetobacteraceae bacterium]|nr:DUF1499 domain-containing protein [Acetobacteraceae bacterium]MDW8398550.1 DUF1499 domain-containing protein [Acetobacteraceae bacterium]